MHFEKPFLKRQKASQVIFLMFNLLVIIPSCLATTSKPTLEDLKKKTENISKMKEEYSKSCHLDYNKETNLIIARIIVYINILNVEKANKIQDMKEKCSQKGKIYRENLMKDLKELFYVLYLFSEDNSTTINFIGEEFDQELIAKDKKYLLNEQNYNFVYTNLKKIVKSDLTNKISCDKYPILAELKEIYTSSKVLTHEKLGGALDNIIKKIEVKLESGEGQKTETTTKKEEETTAKDIRKRLKAALENLNTEAINLHKDNLYNLCSFKYITFENEFYYCCHNLFQGKPENKTQEKTDTQGQLEKMIVDKEKTLADLKEELKGKAGEKSIFGSWIFVIVSIVSICFG